jgi:hypothetical protein
MFAPEVLNFTGKHRCVGSSRVQWEKHIGKIVIATGKYTDLDGITDTILIDEALPVVTLSRRKMDPRAFGVVGGLDEDGRFRLGNLAFVRTQKDGPRVVVQSHGEGAIWVCNANGPLKVGDLITTSSISGYGMKQSGKFKMSYTVAKISCDCDFSSAPRTIKQNDKIYKCAFVGCVYCL